MVFLRISFFVAVFWVCIQFASVASEQPMRIVSLKPNITEILFALRLEARLVGVTDYCDFPPQARALPRVGGYINPSLEAILALKPDLVIGETTGSAEAVERVQHVGIPVLLLSFKTLAEIEHSIDLLGERTGVRQTALQLKQKMQMDFRQKKISKSKKIKTLLVIGRKPLFVVGVNNFITEILELAGGENVAHDARVPFPQFSDEALIARAPEIIIDLSMGSEADPIRQQEALAAWQRFRSVPAVKAGRIYFLNPDLLLRPGPRLGEGLDLLEQTLYPGGEEKSARMK